MSLESLMLNGAKTAFVAAEQNNGVTNVDGAKKMQKAVKTLADKMCKMKEDGKSLFSKAEGSYANNSKYIVLHAMSAGGCSIKLTMQNDVTKARIDAKPYGSNSGGTWNTVTEREALETIARWAGQVAPNAANELKDVLSQFEMQQSIDNGEWTDAPHQ